MLYRMFASHGSTSGPYNNNNHEGDNNRSTKNRFQLPARFKKNRSTSIHKSQVLSNITANQRKANPQTQPLCPPSLAAVSNRRTIQLERLTNCEVTFTIDRMKLGVSKLTVDERGPESALATTFAKAARRAADQIPKLGINLLSISQYMLDIETQDTVPSPVLPDLVAAGSMELDGQHYKSSSRSKDINLALAESFLGALRETNEDRKGINDNKENNNQDSNDRNSGFKRGNQNKTISQQTLDITRFAKLLSYEARFSRDWADKNLPSSEPVQINTIYEPPKPNESGSLCKGTFDFEINSLSSDEASFYTAKEYLSDETTLSDESSISDTSTENDNNSTTSSDNSSLNDELTVQIKNGIELSKKEKRELTTHYRHAVASLLLRVDEQKARTLAQAIDRSNTELRLPSRRTHNVVTHCLENAISQYKPSVEHALVSSPTAATLTNELPNNGKPIIFSVEGSREEIPSTLKSNNHNYQLEAVICKHKGSEGKRYITYLHSAFGDYIKVDPNNPRLQLVSQQAMVETMKTEGVSFLYKTLDNTSDKK